MADSPQLELFVRWLRSLPPETLDRLIGHAEDELERLAGLAADLGVEGDVDEALIDMLENLLDLFER